MNVELAQVAREIAGQLVREIAGEGDIERDLVLTAKLDASNVVVGHRDEQGADR